jgi:hypothetical protein
MGQSNPEVIPVGGNEHLRLVAQAAEGDGMDDPVPIALKSVSRTAGAAIVLHEGPAARSGRVRGKVFA